MSLSDVFQSHQSGKERLSREDDSPQDLSLHTRFPPSIYIKRRKSKKRQRQSGKLLKGFHAE